MECYSKYSSKENICQATKTFLSERSQSERATYMYYMVPIIQYSREGKTMEDSKMSSSCQGFKGRKVKNRRNTGDF